MNFSLTLRSIPRAVLLLSCTDRKRTVLGSLPFVHRQRTDTVPGPRPFTHRQRTDIVQGPLTFMHHQRKDTVLGPLSISCIDEKGVFEPVVPVCDSCDTDRTERKVDRPEVASSLSPFPCLLIQPYFRSVSIWRNKFSAQDQSNGGLFHFVQLHKLQTTKFLSTLEGSVVISMVR